MKTIWKFLVRLWIYLRNLFVPRAIQGGKQCHSTAEVKISEQAAFLCQKYIEDRFTRSDLCYYNPKNRQAKKPTECSQDVVHTLCEVGALLEKGYPKLYSNVLDQLNFRVTLGIIVCNMFNRVSEQIVSSGVSWGRIVALYAFAGALAYDFSQVGETRFIRCLAVWMGQFSAKHLSPWIRQNGGWEGLVHHFKGEQYSLVTSFSRWIRGNPSRALDLMDTSEPVHST